MKEIWKDMVTAVMMGMLLPGFLLNGASALVQAREEQQQQPTIAVESQEETEQRVSLPVRLRGRDGKVSQEEMDDYITGVVMGEMPASFEEEALKAQAVVARTYARKAWESGGKHADGSVCTDPGCCQAYIGREDYLSSGGTEEDWEKVNRAVLASSGWVLSYQGELIEATYFSCSGGSTEDAVAVWGTDFPYLRAVDSPGEEKAAYYRDTVSFTAREFQNALGVLLEGQPDSWFGTSTYTAGGGVAQMEIGGVNYSGTELRRLLGLRSTAFTVKVAGEQLYITTKGYGHRVGMSQYGAEAMAVEGCDFQQILSHYYPGTQLTRLEA